MRAPPKWADRLARMLLDPENAERLIDDLHDEYHAFVAPRRGSVWGALWYWTQVLASVRVLRRDGRRTGPAAARAGPRVGFDSVGQDARYALRQFVKAPTVTAAAVVTLALGIGATTAIFSVVDAVLLRSLPYEEPERIARAWAHTDDGDITDFSFRVAEYRALVAETGTFDAVGAEFPVSLTVVTPDQQPHQVQGRMITSDFFDVFGLAPSQGRMFTRDEIAAGDRLIAVVSHEFWARFLGADSEAVGRSLDLDGNAFTLAGVLPEGYRHVTGSDAHVFIPYTIGTSAWVAHWLDLFVRLRPGASLEQGSDVINRVLRSVAETDRRSVGWNATLEDLHEMVVGDVSATVWAAFAMVALVLLIASVNVASLTLARATGRRGEMAVRTALGAGRGRLVRQLLVENSVLAVVGGAAGVAVAAGSLRVLHAVAPRSIPRIDEVALSSTVLAFAAAVTVTAVLLFGLLPALRTSSLHGQAVRGRGLADPAGRAWGGALGALVIAEVALASMLLVSAGLMVRTLGELAREDLGFAREGALTFRVTVPSARYPTPADTESFYDALRSNLRALPGVTAVGAGSDLPVSGQGAVAGVTSDERVQAGMEEAVTVLQRRATAGFFAALGTPVTEGREFDSRDRADGATVAIVSESLARALFDDGRAVGRRVAFGRSPSSDEWMTVVGVVRDVRYEGVDREPDPQVYQAHPQSAVRQMAVVVRTVGDPLALAEPARALVRGLDPQVPVYDVRTLEGLVGGALAGRRFVRTLFAAFALVAVALTVAGIYGVLTFAVSGRRREIGVRMALGARGSEVEGLVLRRGVMLVGGGLALGGAGAWGTSRLLGGLLYKVPSDDPATFGAVAVGLLAVGVLACWLPARSASRLDPVAVLREE